MVFQQYIPTNQYYSIALQQYIPTNQYHLMAFPTIHFNQPILFNGIPTITNQPKLFNEISNQPINTSPYHVK